VQRAAESGHVIQDGQALLERAQAGEAWAVTVWDAASCAVGRTLVNLANVFAPELICLAGGLAIRRHHQPALAWFDRHVISAQRCDIRWLGRADTLGIRGAATCAAAGGMPRR
jgi:predicted NBD/HSP70 family sugar kinase